MPNQVTDMTAGQIIASAFEKQLSPKGITGQIVVNVVILIFETVGYTIGGKKKNFIMHCLLSVNCSALADCEKCSFGHPLTFHNK